MEPPSGVNPSTAGPTRDLDQALVTYNRLPKLLLTDNTAV